MRAMVQGSVLSSPKQSRKLSVDAMAVQFGVLDFLMLAIPGVAIYASYVGWDVHSSAYLAITLATCTVTVTIFYLSDLYQLEAVTNSTRYWGRIVSILSVVFLVFLAFLFALKQSAELSRVWVFSWFLAGATCIVLGRLVTSHYLLRSARAGKISRNIIVVGGGDQGRRLIRHLASLRKPWINIVGVFDDRSDRVDQDIEGFPLLGSAQDLVAFARNHRCDEIIVSLPLSAEKRIMEIVNRLRVLPVHISLGPDLAGLKYLPTSYRDCAGIPMLRVLSRPIAGWRATLKRAEDWLISVIIVAITLPIMLIVAILIKIESRGPVLFKQRRYGFNNQPIEIYKFRTMKVDQLDYKGSKLTIRNDPRITRVGRFLRRSSLDELPQFFNVIKGEMSVVGPRPHALEAKAGSRLYQDVVAEYAARHRVKPGITGWAQINGWRGETEYDEQILQRVSHDLFYIEHWSLSLDLRIILATVPTVLSAQNAV